MLVKSKYFQINEYSIETSVSYIFVGDEVFNDVVGVGGLILLYFTILLLYEVPTMTHIKT